MPHIYAAGRLVRDVRRRSRFEHLHVYTRRSRAVARLLALPPPPLLHALIKKKKSEMQRL